MTNYEALTSKGRKVRVTGYKPPRIGTIIGVEWYKQPKGGKSPMYVQVDFGQTMGIQGYKSKYLVKIED